MGKGGFCRGPRNNGGRGGRRTYLREMQHYRAKAAALEQENERLKKQAADHDKRTDI